MRLPLILSLTLVLAAGITGPSFAATRVVPDDDATIQAALDSGADTVFVRDGFYPETLLVSREEEPQVLRSHPDNSGTPLIAGLEILLRSRYSFFGLRFGGRVILRTTPESEDLEFERCQLDSGLTQSLDGFGEVASLTVRHCVLGDDLLARSGGGAIFESDTLAGAGLEIHLAGSWLGVTNCLFVGPGAVAIHARTGTSDVFIKRNAITNYVRGIVLELEEVQGGEIADNTIAGCSDWGIVEGTNGGADIVRNQIDHCGGGIRVDSENSGRSVAYNDVRDCANGINVRGEALAISIRANRVLRVNGPGIIAEAFDGSGILVEANVVGRCGSTGIVGSSGADNASIVIRSNTAYANQGHGFGLNVYEGSTTPRLERNISMANSGFGLMASDGIAALTCNDWYFNQSGAVSGLSVDPGDYSVDPEFCDIDSDSVHLTALSPLLAAPGCGLIGALGQGCLTTTEIRVVTLHAARSITGVEIRWRGGLEAADAVVERAPAVAGPWAALAIDPVQRDGEWMAFDGQASPDRDHWYRLFRADGSGAVLAGPILVSAASGPRATCLGAIRPSPSPGPTVIEFTLARAEVVRLGVFDVQGREVALLVHGMRAAGAQLASWNGEGERGRLPGGLYFIRLQVGGRTWARRWVLTR